MKRLLALTLVLLSLCACALCEPTCYDASDIVGLQTHYLLYDVDTYESPCEQAGTVVKERYKSAVYGDKELSRYVNVYLPYGYETETDRRYPVIYFLHGRGCDQTTLLGNPYTINAFDHMIANGDVPPFIVVAPTYYYDVRKNLQDNDLFALEMVQEIIPLVEGKYRTYAESTDEAGIMASRDARALCGFSNGSFTTWDLFDNMMPYIRYYLPCSGGMFGIGESETWVNFEQAARAHDGEYFIYFSTGGEADGAYAGCVELAKKLVSDCDFIRYGTDMKQDNLFLSVSENEHKDMYSRTYIYNALLDGMFQ